MTYQKSIDVINPILGQPYGITVFGIPSALAAQDRPARVSISTWATVHFTQTLTPAAARLLASTLTEAADVASTSEEKARASAEKIVADAHVQVAKDVERARRELHDETLELIALATEKIVRKKLDKKADEALIAEALKEAK